ncbi:endonuclease III [Candidatus Azobacteroides pseudotrichonymphae]|uniref:Endonuclease III n=1 Tax=Azobacteroides pseudotrichonymphae genomovar. CFP2 TaxID=511995 RepID=B6YQ37_AZOPC|nr:endonuclease III [Candidatus Azobacteroides pseudotrichonymphae]BAG83309.1 endonuclease III [Candidatus Azobacteroides pseudotrichonymphae genomovar. CFP2]
MGIKERCAKVIDWFEKNMSRAETELCYTDPFQLLIAVVLAAQCTDKRVNLITPTLFNAFPTPEILASSNEDVIYEYIKSISYPKNKSKFLLAMAKMLVASYAGQVPSNIKELMKLPGVGRKTANVVASIAFGIPAIAVDTHVFRVSNRIGLTNHTQTPIQTEYVLTKHIPKKLWTKAHHWLILHGRYICIARKPHCYNCGLKEFCDYFSKNMKGENI